MQVAYLGKGKETRVGKNKHTKVEGTGCWQGNVDKKFKSNLGKLLVGVLVVLDP